MCAIVARIHLVEIYLKWVHCNRHNGHQHQPMVLYDLWKQKRIKIIYKIKTTTIFQGNVSYRKSNALLLLCNKFAECVAKTQAKRNFHSYILSFHRRTEHFVIFSIFSNRMDTEIPKPLAWCGVRVYNARLNIANRLLIIWQEQLMTSSWITRIPQFVIFTLNAVYVCCNKVMQRNWRYGYWILDIQWTSKWACLEVVVVQFASVRVFVCFWLFVLKSIIICRLNTDTERSLSVIISQFMNDDRNKNKC